jgi:hypothetical protein
MMRVELGREVDRRGRWQWTVAGTSLSGVSSDPLLDACRAIERVHRPLPECSLLIGLRNR